MVISGLARAIIARKTCAMTVLPPLTTPCARAFVNKRLVGWPVGKVSFARRLRARLPRPDGVSGISRKISWWLSDEVLGVRC
jgi:hypothetical protein